MLKDLIKLIDELIPENGLVDLGQISDDDMKIIKAGIRRGLIAKIPCFDFPVIKNKYVKTLDDLK